MDLRALWERWKDVIAYLFFGVCTTAVNAVVYWICAYPLGWSVSPSTVTAWALAVLFAYVTNRTWVFHSQAHGRAEILRELGAFFSCRIATGVVDWACMFVFVDLLGAPDMAVKILDNVLVVILNYVASKLLIFRERGGRSPAAPSDPSAVDTDR